MATDRFLDIIQTTLQERMQDHSWTSTVMIPTEIPEMPEDRITNFKRKTSKYNVLKLLFDICKEVYPVLKKDKNVVYLEGETIIYGDIYSSWNVFKTVIDSILKEMTTTSRKYVFLGGYSQKHSHNIPFLFVLFSLKVKYPERIYMLMGPAEDRIGYASPHFSPTFVEELSVYYSIQKNHTWESIKHVIHNMNNKTEGPDRFNELKDSLDEFAWSILTEVFRCCVELPTCVIVNSKVFVTNGGPFEMILLDKIKSIYPITCTRLELLDLCCKKGYIKREDCVDLSDEERDSMNIYVSRIFYQLLGNQPVMENNPQHQDLISHGCLDEVSGFIKPNFYKAANYAIYTRYALDEFLIENSLSHIVRPPIKNSRGCISEDMRVTLCIRPVLITEDSSVSYM